MTNVLSNSAAAIAQTDKLISSKALAEGRGEVARVEFLSIVSAALLADELGHTEPKKKNGPITETHYAEYAWGVWNTARARVKGMGTINPVKSSRVAELAAIFKAVKHRPDLVNATVNIVAELTAETSKSKDKADHFTARTYDAVIKIARAQFALGKETSGISPMSDDDIKAELLATKDAATEEQRVEAIIKSLKKMEDEFPANAAVYTYAVDKMAAVLAELTKRREASERAEAAATAAATVDDAIWEEMVKARAAAKAGALLIEGTLAA